MTPKISLLDMSPEEITELAESLGETKYRGKQISRWIYGKGARDFGDMTDVSLGTRRLLSEKIRVFPDLKPVKVAHSRDGSRKLLFEAGAGEFFESVLIPEGDRFTLCVSSQIGCPLACAFCRTGTLGFARNLGRGEILAQILLAKKIAEEDGKKITNLVFMGMGEPLLNLENVLGALKIILNPDLLAFPAKRVTVSTVGIPGAMKILGENTKASLAVSLNAATDEKRRLLMPGVPTRDLKELKEAVRAFPLPPGRRVTVGYVLLKDFNDSPEDARALLNFLKGLKVKVNLIPFNAWDGCGREASDPETALAFRKVLTDNNVTAMTRKSFGKDIDAACGQLAGKSFGKNPIS